MRVNTAQTFNFLPAPTDIHFGCGTLKSLPDRIRALGASKAFLVTDPGVKEAHVRQTLIDPLFEALGWDVRNAAQAAPQVPRGDPGGQSGR